MNKSDLSRNLFMLKGPLARKGYDWWWHNFVGYNDATGESKNFFIEYYVCNPAYGGDSPVFGQLAASREKKLKPSYALIKCGSWGKDAKQIHNFYPISAFSYSQKKLDIRIGDCQLTETLLKGGCSVSPAEASSHPEYMCQSGTMTWDLSVKKKIAFNVGYGASPIFRALNLFEMFWHAEGIKTEFDGVVTFDGAKYNIVPEKSFGYSDKNWGSDFTSPWLWISSCDLTSESTGERLTNSAIEIGGGNPKVCGISLGRKLLGGMFHEGETYEYNFSKFWTKPRIDFSFEENKAVNEWHVVASNRNSRMELELKCPRNEMLFINYESPSGEKLHNRLWNGGTGYGEIRLFSLRGGTETLIDRIAVRNAGCEYGEYCDPVGITDGMEESYGKR